jgi:phage terminase Nu1 subunit (DNA packaging protein)
MPDDKLVSSLGLSLALDVTRMAVSKWVADGMPIAGRTEKGHPRFDVDACRAWRLAWKPGRDGRGGKRPGSGRKSIADLAEAENESPVVPNTIAAAVQDGSLSLESADAILRNWTEGRIAPSVAKTLIDTFSAALSRLKLDTELGKLVQKDVVRTEFGEHLRSVRVNLEGLPSMAQDRVRDVLKLTDAHAALVRFELEKIVRAVMRTIAEQPFTSDQDAPITVKKSRARVRR